MINKPPEILVIKSDVTELRKVEDFLKDIFGEYNLEQKYFNKLYLCISEAVINSIKHGNKYDANKTVVIVLDCDNHEINVQIQDEGEGFDMNSVNDPTRTENLKNESGRGIFIIKSLSDKMEYNEKGNIIQIKIECK